MFRMRNSFRSLKDIFLKERSLASMREIVDSSDVIVYFFEIFPNLEKIVAPLSCEKKILKLKVENPAWRNELKFKESEMIENINKHFNEQRITQIRFIG